MPITGTLARVATLGMATHWRDDVDPLEWVTELAKTVEREEQRPVSGEEDNPAEDSGFRP